MKKVLLFSLLLIIGLAGSQILPDLLEKSYKPVSEVIKVLTLVALSFIMIHVGYEFDIQKDKLKSYGWDYLVAMTAAAFPWLFVALYYMYVMLPPELWQSGQAWKEVLLASRFAAPTSAGVLFSMLAAAGLSATWVFRKARILAIFDDLDTVLLMVPLTMLFVGLAWQLGVVILIMGTLLWIAWAYMRRLNLPVSWPWVLGYAAAIVAITWATDYLSKMIDANIPIHIEVLLPAFVLGMLLKIPPGANPHSDDAHEGHQEGPESSSEQRVSTIISAVFMVLVGLSIPLIFTSAGETQSAGSITASQPPMTGWMLVLNVLVVTVISNIGKMFPAFVYRKEAHWRERLAVAISMWPRGEVGAGIIIISLSYGIGGPVATVSILSLTLNLMLTGVFILMVKRLIAGVTVNSTPAEVN